MSRPELLDVLSNPEVFIDLVGIADTDVLKGRWYLGTMDPRETINELREGLVLLNRKNGIADGDLYARCRELSCKLAELAIGAVAIHELPSNSDTIRFVFGTIEKYLEDRGQYRKAGPGPYFIDLFQIMVLAAKPKERAEIFESVAKATGLDAIIR